MNFSIKYFRTSKMPRHFWMTVCLVLVMKNKYCVQYISDLNEKKIKKYLYMLTKTNKTVPY